VDFGDFTMLSVDSNKRDGTLIRLEDHMPTLSSPPPSSTTGIFCCPQCGAVTNIKLVEPDLNDPHKAWHIFECEECGLPRTYLVDRQKPESL
jgi:hypothetical protein